VIAGIGNVFRAEVLLCCGIHPGRPGRSLSEPDLTCVWDTATALMRRGVAEGRIVTVEGHDGAGDGRYVYKQEACGRCGGPVSSWRLGPRTAYACETCQPR
jgi:formamidopyrimidine-DNA glycosylase